VIIRLPHLPLWLLLSPLLWLALLALPGRAQAAAAVPPCHHAQAQAAAVHMAALRQDAGHVHGPADMHACSGHDAHGGHAGGHDQRCASGCGACCAAVALAPAPPAAPSAAGPDFIAIPFRAGHLPSVDPALPERPPRSLFA
jgi:hypothetical protein